MSSSRLCQTGQTIKSKGWQEEKPFCPSSPRPPTCRTRRTSSPPELPHPASSRRPTFCRAKEKVKPGARSADLRATNITFPPLPGARAPQNKTPSRAVRLPAHATARPGCPPSSLPPSFPQPSGRGPARREAWTAACAERIPAPTRTARGSTGRGEPRGAEGSREGPPPVPSPSLLSGQDERSAASGASARRFRPAPPQSRGAILWG